MKALGLTEEEHSKLGSLSMGEEIGIPGVAVKCVDIGRNTGGESGFPDQYYAEARRCGEQTGLDTLVVRTVNGDHLVWRVLTPAVPKLTH